VARTCNAAAAAALGRVMLVDGEGGNDSRNIQDAPLIADILGSNYLTPWLPCKPGRGLALNRLCIKACCLFTACTICVRRR
jgi:hypothetical protein